MEVKEMVGDRADGRDGGQGTKEVRRYGGMEG